MKVNLKKIEEELALNENKIADLNKQSNNFSEVLANEERELEEIVKSEKLIQSKFD